MWLVNVPDQQFPTDSVTFTEEILNEKLHLRLVKAYLSELTIVINNCIDK